MGTAVFLLSCSPSRQGPEKNERRKRDTNLIKSDNQTIDIIFLIGGIKNGFKKSDEFNFSVIGGFDGKG